MPIQEQYSTPKRKIFSSFDTSFSNSDSPITLDLNATLVRNSVDGYIHNNGTGRLTFQTSADGTNFDSKINLGPGLVFSLRELSVDSIKLTWVEDTAYEVFAV